MFMDIGAGILIAFGVSEFFGQDVSLGFLALGVLFALLPDIDIFFPHLPGGKHVEKLIGSHRSMLHNPFLYVPVVPIIFFFFGAQVGVLFVSGLFFHFLHDTFFLGWGIKWLWPFSDVKISLFHDKNGKITKDVLVWKPDQEQVLQDEYKSAHWIRDFYFRPSIISLTEYPVFLVALMLAFQVLW